MSRVAALLVTHDAQRWIGPLLASIVAQTRAPDVVVVVDDHSRDGTADLLRDALSGRLVLLEASTSTTDRKTRIARNFEQGLR
ncbi:glycosyltransferase, partial [Escherichia coli]|uniref:glycosyltransferase n=1 Tax=Escherichia coli TaxID=562 RepID=UPI001E3E1812